MTEVLKMGLTGCWLHTGSNTNQMGHVRLGRAFGRRGAHVVAWEKVNGPVPPGLIICHTCDVPNCVQPRHLYAGTVADNARDRSVRGRQTPWNLGHTALPLAEIRELRGAGLTQASIAKQLGISQASVSRALGGEHVLG